MPQLTVAKIISYGPWTLELGSDREHELQMLQASLYGEVQRLFSERGGLAFPNRADEFFVVSNGVGPDEHVRIQKELEGRFEQRLAMSIGSAPSPLEADRAAHGARESGTYLDRKHNLYGNTCTSEGATIMHLDVEDLTSTCKSRSSYQISSMIFGLYSKMSEFFLNRGSLAFFMGGDNFMIVAGSEARRDAEEFVAAAKRDGLTLNCGIGTGRTGREAAGLATKSLDEIRKIRDSGGERPQVYEMSC